MDASFSDGLGRLVNDAPPQKANSTIRKVRTDGICSLHIYGKKDINIGDQITYDYGVNDLPWRTKKGTTKLVLCIKLVYGL